MYIVTLTYIVDKAKDVTRILEGIPAPSNIDVTEVIDVKEQENIRKKYPE